MFALQGGSSKHSGGSISSLTSSHSSGDNVPAPPHLVKPKLISTRNPLTVAGQQPKKHKEPVSDDSGSSQDSGIGGSSVLSLASRLQETLGGMGVSSSSSKTARTADTSRDHRSSLVLTDNSRMKPPVSAKPNRAPGSQVEVKLPVSSQNPDPPPKGHKPDPPSKTPLVGPKPSSNLAKLQSTNATPSLVSSEKRSSLESSDMVSLSGSSKDVCAGLMVCCYQYTCLWDYEASAPDDLSIRRGDTIIVTDQSNSDWWIGTCGGIKGIFPAAYVRKSEY